MRSPAKSKPGKYPSKSNSKHQTGRLNRIPTRPVGTHDQRGPYVSRSRGSRQSWPHPARVIKNQRREPSPNSRGTSLHRTKAPSTPRPKGGKEKEYETVNLLDFEDVPRALTVSPIRRMRHIAKSLKLQARAENISFGSKLHSYMETLLATMYLVLMLISSRIIMIIIGQMNIDECPANLYIPIFLTTYGVVGLLTFVLIFVEVSIKQCFTGDSDALLLTKCTQCVLLGLYPLGCIIFLCGNIAIFTTFGNLSYNVNDADYCDPTTFWLAFGIILFDYTHFLLLVVFSVFCYHLADTNF